MGGDVVEIEREIAIFAERAKTEWVPTPSKIKCHQLIMIHSTA